VDRVEIRWTMLKYGGSYWNTVDRVEIRWTMLKYGGS